MKLKAILKEIPELEVKGPKEIEISGISANSKLAGPGSLFVAKKGRQVDGASFIHEALSNGAVAILTDIYDPSLKNTTQLIYPDVAKIEAKVASSVYQHPARKLWMVGITGTNGKTTTSFAIKHLLDEGGDMAGLIGTIEYKVGQKSYAASRTTPDVSANHKLLKEMVAAGSKACVMEVTSHALDQGRVAEIAFDVAVFTNLSHEHLDYHKNMEEYFKAKQALFLGLTDKAYALLNADDPWAIRCRENTKAKVITFGIEKRADIQATGIEFTPKGTHFNVEYQGQNVAFFWPLVGRFNVYNALSAIGVGLARGMSLASIAERLIKFRTAPGRLEAVENRLGLEIYVDYAHKPEALKNVLQTLKELVRGKIITVFGCGGDRDREKRPLMGKVSEELSSITIVTSDNPRSEDPEVIINEILSGFKDPSLPIREPDRKKAIWRAIELAKENDIVLIAGKGHETQQIFANKIIDFDDRLIAKERADALAASYCSKK